MAVPTKADLLVLSYTYQGAPFVAVEGSSGQNSLALGFAFHGQPFVGAGMSGITAATTGLRITKGNGSTIELLLVAENAGASGMGGVPVVNKNGTNYALYLVETSDGKAGPVRISTTTGIKSVRLPD